jgi:hypothetical protein
MQLNMFVGPFEPTIKSNYWIVEFMVSKSSCLIARSITKHTGLQSTELINLIFKMFW